MVGILRKSAERRIAQDSFDELASLATSAGGKVVGGLLQERQKIDPATFIGKGKAEEIAQVCKEKDVDLVIFDDNLSPAQASNLERITGRRVIDRSQLILDIFALGARTSIAKAQVELAQIEYTLPRLKRMWKHLSRTAGGIGTRGPGETQLEVDRRRMRQRMHTLKRLLRKFEVDRAVRTARRKDLVQVSLAGYTNTGKSTLFNRLTCAYVATGDRLFETLDTTTRIVRLPMKERVLISDTVGFIRKLPHHLIASFHATLECIVEADLVIHVADISHPECEMQIEAANAVINEICGGTKQQILIFNKIDMVSDQDLLNAMLRKYDGAMAVSAVKGWGIDKLRDELLEFVLSRKQKVRIQIPATDGRLLDYIYRYSTVLSRQIGDGKITVLARVERRYLEPLSPYLVEVG
ncbi:MAG: GTPase HflX [bacterium]